MIKVIETQFFEEDSMKRSYDGAIIPSLCTINCPDNQAWGLEKKKAGSILNHSGIP